MIDTDELRSLCSPAAEAIGEKLRIDMLVRMGHAAADEIDRLRDTVQHRCGHYSREHHAGGWTCPTCGATGLPNT